jgi:GntR family transcriptional regulator/MocR family aminotransferase
VRPRAELNLPLAVDRSAPTPMHHQLASALRNAVVQGLLRPGSRLPPSRLLGAQLRLARSTVLAAYEQLAGEGYLETRHGSGTFVNAHLPPAAPRSRAPAVSGELVAAVDQVDLRPGQPDTARLVDKAWRAAWRHATSNPVPAVEPTAQGLTRLRQEVARHLREARGLPADPADVFITAGTGDGLALIVHALGPSSRPVAVEDPGYPAARRILTRLGCHLEPVPVDGDGLLVDRLASLPTTPRLALVTPSHQYPLGGCLPVARRLALLDWARREDALIVEDDYDSEFRFAAAPLPALASLDPDGPVVHLGTFSKVLSPWLRAGYLLAPPGLGAALLAARTDLGTPVSGVDQQALAHYLASGALPRHIGRARRDYAHRRLHLTRLLAAHPQLRLRGTRAGLHAVIDLPPDTDVTALLRTCAQQGLLLADLLEYYATPGPTGAPAVVLGYGGTALGELQRAVTLLAACTR